MSDTDERLRKLKALALKPGTDGERAAALATIERVNKSAGARLRPLFSNREPLANRRSAIERMMRERGPSRYAFGRERLEGAVDDSEEPDEPHRLH
jgi:hypothetical protein